MRALVLLVILALAHAAHADDATRAKELFDAGREQLKAEHYAEACDRFSESLALDPATGTQLNLAECLAHLGEHARAQALFEAAATDDDAAGNSKRAAFARARAADEARLVTPAVVTAATPLPPPPPPKAVETRRRRSRVYLAVGLGIGAAGALIAGGLLASASQAEYRAQIDSGECFDTGADLECGPDGARAIEHSQATGDLAETLAISGAALGVAALVTFLTAPRDPIVPILVVDRTTVGFAIAARF